MPYFRVEIEAVLLGSEEMGGCGDVEDNKERGKKSKACRHEEEGPQRRGDTAVREVVEQKRESCHGRHGN